MNTVRDHLQAILDLSVARVNDSRIDENTKHDMSQIAISAQNAFECLGWIPANAQPKHYPPGMGEESRRLHREYNKLVAAQNAGAQNGRDVRRLTDECEAKGIILVPNGENL